MSNEVVIPTTRPDIRQKMLESLGRLAVQFEEWSQDIKAIEVVTATGSIDVNIEDLDKSDITSIANGKASKVKGNLKIVARTRFELDGDLLVLLPTKDTPTAGTDTKGTTTGTDTKGTTTGTDTKGTTTGVAEIDREMLEIHNHNVNTAMQNLQFIIGKIMDIATELLGRNLPQTATIRNPFAGISGIIKASK